MSTVAATHYPSYALECGDPSRTKILGFGDSAALLLVDVCLAYLNPNSPITPQADLRDGAAASIVKLLAAAREANNGQIAQFSIIYAQTKYTHPTLRDAGLQALKNGSAPLFSVHHPDNLLSVPDELAPRENEIVLMKKFPSPFFGTNLAAQLTSMGVDTLLICGFTTSSNVRAATLDAMQSGFRAMVVGDACADLGSETHYANLMDLGAKYGDVVEIEIALSKIKETASRKRQLAK